MNAAEIKGKLATAGGRADRLAKDEREVNEKIHELYMAADLEEVFKRDPVAHRLQQRPNGGSQ